MEEPDEATIARIRALARAEVAKDRNRSRAIHEAGHAVAAVHLDLPLESVDIEEKESSEGWKIGGTRVRAMDTIFSKKELDEQPAHVVDDVKNRVVYLLAAAEARMLIEEGLAEDKFAQFDQSDIERARKDFPQLDDSVMNELTTTAKQLAAKRRAEIDKVTDALIAKRKLTAQEVRDLMSDKK
jgi:hypothetical protein